MNWLKRSFPYYFISFSTRIAFLYYMFESLRLRPEFSESFAVRLWGSPNPVTDLWTELLEWSSEKPEFLELASSELSRNSILSGADATIINTTRERFLDFIRGLETKEKHFKIWRQIMELKIGSFGSRDFVIANPEQVRNLFKKGFDNWRKYVHPVGNTAFSDPGHILDSIRILSPLSLIAANSACRSLLLSMLAEVWSRAHFQSAEFSESRCSCCAGTEFQILSQSLNERFFAFVFENHFHFARWLKEVPGRNARSLLGRIAYRYYVLERLRCFPDLSELVSKKCGWESSHPADAIWQACLDSGVFSNNDTSDHLVDADKLLLDSDQSIDVSLIDFGELLTDFNQLTNCGPYKQVDDAS
eukprot:Gregarina_sp_Poly_1__515@NODE_1124_length_5018_cov_43_139972_g778_i0_p1_GENE_NODE_1124_length_5018_cov_43_139972_g778_i0NODE_1124_length_5018_cov_43_139972_g778_i0_p1_ORF_typecomplete_len360_score30_47GDPD_2/PF13653_6/0_35GDPD_2/PF13653_6/3_5e03_NODE_1124_length_5018_cov_43_139972_g778_i024763555